MDLCLWGLCGSIDQTIRDRITPSSAGRAYRLENLEAMEIRLMAFLCYGWRSTAPPRAHPHTQNTNINFYKFDILNFLKWLAPEGRTLDGEVCQAGEKYCWRATLSLLGSLFLVRECKYPQNIISPLPQPTLGTAVNCCPGPYTKGYWIFFGFLQQPAPTAP